MAKQTLIIDDLSGDTGARTRRFSLDGTDYEIDLTDASFRELKDALKPFIKAGRAAGGGAARGRATGAPTRRRGKAAAKAPSEAALVRAWARSKGKTVTERGRVAPDLHAAWVAAGSPRV